MSCRCLCCWPLAAGQDGVFASDPNLGRILAAIGYAGIADLDVDNIRVWLASAAGETLVAEHGGRAAAYTEDQGAAIMADAEITIRIDLARGMRRPRCGLAIFPTTTSRSTLITAAKSSHHLFSA